MSTLTAHALILGNGTGNVATAGLGTSGQVFTSQGPSSDGAMQDPVGATSSFTTLASTYTISVDNGVYEDTGLSRTLPGAGTYFFWYQARSNINVSTTPGGVHPD